MKLVQMFRHRVGIHFHVRVFRFVSLEVDFEVAFGGETIATHITLEGTFTSVGTNVYL